MDIGKGSARDLLAMARNWILLPSNCIVQDLTDTKALPP